MRDRKYLVGILPESVVSGVGLLMKKLAVDSMNKGYKIIAPREKKSISDMLKSRKYFQSLFEILLRSIFKLFFSIRLWLIRNSTVVFVHPQSIGFMNLFSLLSRNKVYLYVMDNSFFCLRSYNIDPICQVECFKCLSTPLNSYADCQPFPSNILKETNIEYLLMMKKASKKINFLAQNNNQKLLLQRCFGKSILCEVIGIDTGEVEFRENKLSSEQQEKYIYDLVYHGAPHLAKGIKYFIDLAEMLPEVSCFIPSSREVCEQVTGNQIESRNITFQSCNWNSGLKIAIERAIIVVNPSLWSAPIEGAFLKSIKFGNTVAVVETQFGFEKEAADYVDLLRLPRDIPNASVIIREFLKEFNHSNQNIKQTIRDLSFCKQKSIFDVVH